MEAHVAGCIRATASFSCQFASPLNLLWPLIGLSNGLLSMLSTSCMRAVPDYELVLERMVLQEKRAVDLVAWYTSLFATIASLAGLQAPESIESQN